MSKITELFQKKKNNILNVYCTAGYPQLNSTIDVMRSLQENGADMIELGLPYSDPLADGPVIQASNTIALRNGMSISFLFKQLQNFRDRITVPVILMGYMNPVLQYGFDRFCNDAARIGIDGLILPDLPEYEFETIYRRIIRKYGLDFIFLVTPETSEDRVKKLDSLSSGFLYAVSSSSTTGAGKNITDVASYLKRLKNYHLQNPVLVGFGIKDRKTFSAVCQHAAGAIVGTAYINALSSAATVEEATQQFLNSLKN